MLGQTHGFPRREFIYSRGLVIQGGTVALAGTQSFVSMAGTWNTTGVATALKVNVTNTTSGASSLLCDFQTGGVSQFKVDKAGVITSAGSIASGNAISSQGAIVAGGSVVANGGSSLGFNGGKSKINCSADGLLELLNTAGTGFTRLNFGGTTSSFPALQVDGYPDLMVIGAGGATNARLCVVNSYTSSTNFERLELYCGADSIFQIRSVAGSGGGTVRALKIGVDSHIMMTIDSTGLKLGFFDALTTDAVVQQTSGANLTNNVTAGGTTDQIDNYTDLIIYANDAAAIRNDIYQLARKLKQVNDALRAYRLLT